MSEKKTVRKSVAIALGIICILLMAGLIGTFAYYLPIISNENCASFTGNLSTSSYIVSNVGNYWVAQNGTTGDVVFNYTDSYTVLQDCIARALRHTIL